MSENSISVYYRISILLLARSVRFICVKAVSQTLGQDFRWSHSASDFTLAVVCVVKAKKPAAGFVSGRLVIGFVYIGK